MTEEETEKERKKILLKDLEEDDRFLDHIEEEENREFGVARVKRITLYREDEKSDICFEIKIYPKLLEKPEPIIIEGIRYCSWCYERNNRKTPLTHKRFLCEEHYKEYHREKEKLRQRAKRKEKREAKEQEYMFKLGTTDFSYKMCRDPKNEAKIIRKEKERIFREKTIGDFKVKKRLFWIPDEDEDN
jgi:hypothetical protein